MNPFECYKTYISLKNHFTKQSYDYHKYRGKSKVTIQSFYKRKDRFWFEKISRNKSDEEIINFFVSNFSSCDDPQSLWIGQIIKEGEKYHMEWNKKIQSLSYIFKNEINEFFNSKNFDQMFKIQKNSHPQIIKEFLKKNISLETLIILDKILNYKKRFDSKMSDPIWQLISFKIEKYAPFLSIDITRYKNILKECVL
jgi:hypothetical protein